MGTVGWYNYGNLNTEKVATILGINNFNGTPNGLLASLPDCPPDNPYCPQVAALRVFVNNGLGGTTFNKIFTT